VNGSLSRSRQRGSAAARASETSVIPLAEHFLALAEILGFGERRRVV
jgi:hypothetical protein